MIDADTLLAIGGGVVAVAVAVWVFYKWNKIKEWATRWLEANPGFQRLVAQAEFIVEDQAAAIKRGADRFLVSVLGIDKQGRRFRVISENEFDVDKTDELLKKVKEDPVLAMCN